MEFLNEQGNKIKLKESVSLPGYEVMLSEDVIIDSVVDNPFFKDINILQLPKKLKGFRNNPDLRTLLEPQRLNTGIKLLTSNKEFVWFEPSVDLTVNKRLNFVNHAFGNEDIVQPLFINMGIKKVHLQQGIVIGTLLVIPSN